MITRPFFSLVKPKLQYPVIEDQAQDTIKEIPLPNEVILLHGHPFVIGEELNIKVGDEVRTGQRLRMTDRDGDYLISTVTGNITGISAYTGYMAQSFTSISIGASGTDQWDVEVKEAGITPTFEHARDFLNSLPGNPDFASYVNARSAINTIVISGTDKDLLVTTNQRIVKNDFERVAGGVKHLKEMAPESKIIIVVPPDLAFEAGKTGAEVRVTEPDYPNTLPKMIMKNIMGRVVPAGKSCEETGVWFINAEAVGALPGVFTEGKIPVDKVVTVIGKDYTSVNVKVRIGTPVKDILNALHIETQQGDQLVLGGPMTGQAVYTEDVPVSAGTDAIMVQDRDRVVLDIDNPCINCGECVRVCPAKIPVNMLVRLLDCSLYEDAAKDYDLFSCIECGLCSYVCTARIPVLHHIMHGKYQFARLETQEESNA